MATVIDSSALLALLLAEPGSDTVEAAMADASMSSVNLAECVEVLERRNLDWTDVEELVAIPSLTIEPLAVATAIAAGKLASLTRGAGLSLGDRCCLALAMQGGQRVLTADRAWLAFAEPLNLQIDSIR
jgi:ribonuclease VapC